MSARGLAGSAPRALLTVVIGNGAGGRRIGLEDGALLIVGSRRLVGVNMTRWKRFGNEID